jgi:hypothetical protein
LITSADTDKLFYKKQADKQFCIHNEIFLRRTDMRRLLLFGIILAGVISFGVSEAGQTKLVVRAKSKDAKFVGTSMGGAHVVIKDSETGKVLAEGLTEGGTGNTQLIMVEPKTRFGSITDGSTAKFEAVIDIQEPELVTIDVDAPYGMRPKTVRSSTQIWLIPGKDIVGDGLIVEVPGFFVDANSPSEAVLGNDRAVIPVQARVAMIWGCHLTPGGLWDSSKYEIRALVKYEGKIIDTIEMAFAGPSAFQGEAVVKKKGEYEIIVYAFDPQTGNTGVDKVKVTVQ